MWTEKHAFTNALPRRIIANTTTFRKAFALPERGRHKTGPLFTSYLTLTDSVYCQILLLAMNQGSTKMVKSYYLGIERRQARLRIAQYAERRGGLPPWRSSAGWGKQEKRSPGRDG
jgi:hypothetical protein